MKKRFLFLLSLGALLLWTACQKELSLETSDVASAGSLQSDTTGDCLPKTVQGVYEVGTVLDGAANYIDVQVNVTGVGSYLVFSDTVNGMFFQASGVFATAGLNTVRLPGDGTPLSAGIHNFVITYDSTACTVAITTLAQGEGVAAAFTLAGAPDTCINYVLTGDYSVGVATTAANTVALNVDVTVPGTYNLTTTVSNGITFSGAGSFISPGAQTIVLAASGTPAVAGSTNIPITVGASSCSFMVDIATQ